VFGAAVAQGGNEIAQGTIPGAQGGSEIVQVPRLALKLHNCTRRRRICRLPALATNSPMAQGGSGIAQPPPLHEAAMKLHN